MPRRRRQHRVRAAVGQWYRLAPTHHGPNTGDLFDEHCAHAIVGFHRDDLIGSIGQKPGQCSGTGADVDDPANATGEKPIHRRHRWSRSIAFILRRDATETPRALRPLVDAVWIRRGHTPDPISSTPYLPIGTRFEGARSGNLCGWGDRRRKSLGVLGANSR
jgi:hypothetical protein